METKSENMADQNFRPMPQPQSVLFAPTSDAGITVGVVAEAEPSSLSLLAAGVAGMAARRARHQRLKK
jgi:hypothetical protein